MSLLVRRRFVSLANMIKTLWTHLSLGKEFPALEKKLFVTLFVHVLMVLYNLMGQTACDLNGLNP